MSTTEPRVLNLGTYGVVLSPALQNEPPYENDPLGQITKVFYHKKDYDILLKKRKKLAKILGTDNEGYRFETYEREWLGRNFPPKAYRLLSEAANENRDHSFTRFYPIRMTHLGTSIQTLRKGELARCDVAHLLAAIKKIFHVLGKLAEHHTLHGDIHNGNLLVYMAPPFCDISLIDYDLFETYDEMKKAYADGRNRMYGPPESYFLLEPHLRPPLSVNRISNHNENKENNENKEDDHPLQVYFARFYNNEYIQTLYPDIQTLEDQIRQAILAHGDKPIHYSQMDSFLASAVFLHLLYRTYPFLKRQGNQPRQNSTSLSPQEEQAIQDTVEVLIQGFSFSSARRLGPDDIVARLQRILSRLRGQKTPPSLTPSSPSLTPSCPKNKNKNGCILSGGTRKRAKKMKKTRRVKQR